MGLTAFVFQGGGSLSAPQVGMLRALTEAGARPDLVIGSSAGALNAVAYATDPTPSGIDRLEQLWLRLRRRDVAGLSVRNLLRTLTGHADGLFTAAPLVDSLAGGIVAERIDRTDVSAHVVATDLGSGEPVVLSGGATVPALLATSAFPGLYSPVTIDGFRLVDGGVSADIPVLQAENLGARMCYVLPAATSPGSERPARGPLALAYRALGLLLDAAARRDTASAAGEVHLLPAPTSAASNPLDFGETRRLIDDGYRLACDWLAGRVPVASAGTASTVPA